MKDSIQPKRARRGFLWWAGRSTLGLVAVLVIGLGMALATGPKAKVYLKAKYPPPGSLVDLNGYRLHIFCEGSGSPTVIMETGLGNPGVIWELVRPEVARTTRTCVYDRAGLGWSDASPKPPTAENTVAELHTLLTQAGVDDPYVLVGHSMGGVLVRLYAHTYPEEVVGMVLVDSSHEDQFSRFPAALISISDQGDQQSEQAARRNRPLVDLGLAAVFRRLVPSSHPQAIWGPYDAFVAMDMKTSDAQAAEGKAFMDNLQQVGAAHITTLGDIPLIVLSHGRDDNFSVSGLSADDQQLAEQAWQQMQAELAQLSPRGEKVVASESGHYIQLDQPQLVIDAIEQVVAEVRQ